MSLPDGGTSVRECAKVAIDTVSERDYGYAPLRYTEARRAFYLDPQTGLVVFDVVQYEKWLGEGSTEQAGLDS